MASSTFDDLMDTVFDALGRTKKNRTPGASAIKPRHPGSHQGQLHRAAAVARRTPEVMVKVSGSAKGLRGVREHMNYITRNGKLVAESELGEPVAGRDAVGAVASEWQQADQGARRVNSKDTVNVVLSMPPGTDRDKLHHAARQFARRNFNSERRYLLVRHDDTKHPHCHLALRAVGYDGQRMNPRKADLQAWRESFAECLRETGLAAEATPRASRGVVRKGKRQSILHAERRGASTVARSKVNQAAQRAIERTSTERPWEVAIEARQRTVRRAWIDSAKILQASDVENATALAQRMRQFVRDMPPIQTAQQELATRMREHVANKHVRDASHDIGRER